MREWEQEKGAAVIPLTERYRKEYWHLLCSLSCFQSIFNSYYKGEWKITHNPCIFLWLNQHYGNSKHLHMNISVFIWMNFVLDWKFVLWRNVSSKNNFTNWLINLSAVYWISKLNLFKLVSHVSMLVERFDSKKTKRCSYFFLNGG